MNQHLKEKQLAPNFTAQLWDGSNFQLSSCRGKKLWLAFFRYASCPLCNLRVHEIIQQYDIFQKSRMQIAAIFQSPKESITEYVGKQKPFFPLISDPEEKLYFLYGLDADLFAFIHPGNLPLLGKAFKHGFKPGKLEGTLTRIPADFLIDENGIIQVAFYGNKIGDHIPMDKVMNFAIGKT